jgi:hypothetical protein
MRAALLLTFFRRPVLRAAAVVGEAVQSNDRAAHVDAVPAPREVAPPLRPALAGQ